jgi:hypothetical protein
MPATLNFEFFDVNDVPISGELFINGISVGVDTTFNVASVTVEENIEIQFVPTNVDHRTYEQTFFIPSTLDDVTTEIPVIITEITDNNPHPSFIYFRRACTNTFDFYLTSTTYYSDILWDFGNNTSGLTQPQNIFAGGRSYEVELFITICEDNFEPGCCGGQVNNPDCVTGSITSTLITGHRTPESFFLFTCPSEIPESTSLEDCGCAERAICSCVEEGSEVTVVPQVELNQEDCEDPAVVNLYVDDVLVQTQSVSSPEDVENVSLSFPVRGSYEVRQEVVTCCGSCSYTKKITVGEPISIKRTDCLVVEICNNRAYNNPVLLQINVKDLTGTIINTYSISNYEGEDALTILLPNDGIYTIEFIEIVNSSIVYQKDFIVYEFCNIVNCYRKLVEKLLCPECDCEVTVKDQQDLQNKINEFIMVATAFYASVKIQFGETFGLFYQKPEYLNTLREHELLLKQLQKICGNCGVKNLTSPNPKDCGCLLPR